MEIMSKIRAWRAVMADLPEEAERLQRESTEAVLGGMQSAEWETFMRNFHSNGAQLSRLLGKDDFIKNHDYGKTILAYLAGDGTCGGGTNFSGMLDEISGEWRDDLDAGLPTDIEAASNPVEIPEP